VDEIHRRDFRIAQVRERFVAVRARPVVAREQARGGAVGERR